MKIFRQIYFLQLFLLFCGYFICVSFHKLDLKNNYWGALSAAQMNTSIWDYYDDFLVGIIVDYAPVDSVPFSLAALSGCDQISSVPKSENTTTINIYPNPFFTEGILRTDFIMKDAVLNIYDLTGRAVKEIHIKNTSSVKLSRDGLCEGMYFYRLNTGNTSTNGSFVIQ